MTIILGPQNKTGKITVKDDENDKDDDGWHKDEKGAWVVGKQKKKSNYVAAPSCHTGRVGIVAGKQATLYAAGLSHGYKPDIEREALIDLTGTVYAVPDIISGTGWFGVNQNIVYPADYLRLYVTDMQAPRFGVEVLRAVRDGILKHITTGRDVVIFCQGGHGRTGTVLAGLLPILVSDPVNTLQPNPVSWLRKLYCSHVVESSVQLEWIKKIHAELNFSTEFDYTDVEISKATYAHYGGGNWQPTKRTCAICQGDAWTEILAHGEGNVWNYLCWKCAGKPENLICALCGTKDNVTVAADPLGQTANSKIVICPACLKGEQAKADVQKGGSNNAAG